MSLIKSTKTVHKWLSLVVGVQLIIWLATGVYFNLSDHHKAGGHEYRAHSHSEQRLSAFELTPITAIASKQPISVKLIWVLERPYYYFVYQMGEHNYQKKHAELFDAVTGEPFSLSASQALMIAQQSYSGPGQLNQAELVQPPFDDYVAQQNPLWKVDVADDNNTTIYLDAVTGQVLRHANDDFRLNDLMLKLHFMDYGNSGGFNHWLIICFAIFTLLLSITGGIWLIQQYQNGLLKLSWSRNFQTVSVTFAGTGTRCDISANESDSILEGLASSRVHLPSSCGGGGTCGKCLFKSVKPLPITSAETEQLSEQQLAQGYRLGCQHKIAEIDEVEAISSSDVGAHELMVVSSTFITPFIKELKCKVKSGKPLTFKAGAYMEFDIPAGTNQLRPTDMPKAFEKYWRQYAPTTFSHDGGSRHYSLVNFDQETDQLTFNIRWQISEDGHRAGVGSSYLAALEVGDTVIAKGPYSDFFATSNQASDQQRRIFIGAGSGLAPLRAIIFEQLKKYHCQQPMMLIYGARTEDDLLYHTELEELDEHYDNFTYIPTLSLASSQWQGHRGYVQKVLAAQLNEAMDLDTSEFYLCGPIAMMKEVETMLLDIGVPERLIFKDRFSR
ncbi:2Fe-2S iron-sulfur cluster-binding protein [Thalassotalea ponticola]|uniref:2Fe-2S iron-sulfur cluster-binding protein n=1 Tax=Thalassotalea ponticola TaxID=1523392 RepID=UPI0025B46821|nr:2Fe-2S iron-sulfur cluster-binding protein [Thalassotalea ponticola]MDN3651848.1 2Fe-2S iron-sulfur cluster-binding protein [Thalassotalea ponticola]